MGQNPRYRPGSFQSYQVDTIHIKGDPAAMKRNVISVQKQDGIRSAFWDEKDNILTVEYDASLLELNVIRQYFIANLTTKTIIIVARLKKVEE
jgi:hypothetical protein